MKNIATALVLLAFSTPAAAHQMYNHGRGSYVGARHYNHYRSHIPGPMIGLGLGAIVYAGGAFMINGHRCWYELVGYDWNARPVYTTVCE